jgi:hypothetical protein
VSRNPGQKAMRCSSSFSFANPDTFEFCPSQILSLAPPSFNCFSPERSLPATLVVWVSCWRRWTRLAVAQRHRHSRLKMFIAKRWDRSGQEKEETALWNGDSTQVHSIGSIIILRPRHHHGSDENGGSAQSAQLST